MKKTNKAIAVILCLALCISLCSTLAFADNGVSYLAIGDSTSQGYFTEGFTLGEEGLGDYASPYSYPFQFRNYLEEKYGSVTFYQYTLQGLRPGELYAILEPEKAEPYMDWLCRQQLDEYIAAYANVYGGDLFEGFMNAVRDADVITYDSGLNCFGNFFAQSFMQLLTGDMSAFSDSYLALLYNQLDPTTAATCDKLREVFSKSLEALAKENAALAESAVDLLVYCYASFVFYYDKTIDIIYRENEDVDLLVFSMSSNLAGVVFSIPTDAGEILLDLGSLLETMYSAMNTHITMVNKNAAKYKFVDIESGVETIVEEIASGELTDATRDYIVDDIKNLGYNDEDVINAGIEAYIKASGLKKLDLLGAMDVLANGDMSESARHCIEDYDSASDGDKACLHIYIRSTCANGFGSHPSIKGGYEKFDALVKAYEGKTMAPAYSLRSLFGIGVHSFKTGAQMIKNPVLNAMGGVFDSIGSQFTSFLALVKQTVESFIMQFMPVQF